MTGMRKMVTDLLKWWFTVSIFWHRVIVDVHDDCIETIGWWTCYYCILVQMDKMLISSKWDYLLRGIQTRYCINSCCWKLLRKYWLTITHALFHCSTVYTVILSTLLLLHHWYCNCHRIVLVIEIIWILIDLNNNVNRQLAPGLRKYMEEIMFVFWVDLGYRLRIRRGFHCRVLVGWLTPHPVPVPVYICCTCYLTCYTCYLTTLQWGLVQRQESGLWSRVCTGPT